MIATSCPYCDRAPDLLDYAPEDAGKWAPALCEGCGEVMWIHLTRLPAETLSSEDFIATIVAPTDPDRVAWARDVVCELKAVDQ
jgi:glutaredoxin